MATTVTVAPLTYSAVNALTAGSIIDALIEEFIMSGTWHAAAGAGYEGSTMCLTLDTPYTPTIPPAYSSDYALALAVATAEDLEIDTEAGNVHSGTSDYSVSFATIAGIPLAICKSALLKTWTLTP